MVMVVLEELVMLVGKKCKGNLLFNIIFSTLKPWLARSMGFVAVGERATFYLNESRLCCNFVLRVVKTPKFLWESYRIPPKKTTGQSQCTV